GLSEPTNIPVRALTGKESVAPLIQLRFSRMGTQELRSAAAGVAETPGIPGIVRVSAPGPPTTPFAPTTGSLVPQGLLAGMAALPVRAVKVGPLISQARCSGVGERIPASEVAPS